MGTTDKRLEERIWHWKEETEKKLQKRWWLWIIILVLALCEERLLKSTNEFLDTKAGRMADVARQMLVYVPANPVLLAVVLGVAVIIGLTVHAYFDTRNQTARPVVGGKGIIFHPHLEKLGRRIETAFFGSANAPAFDVLSKIQEYRSNRRAKIPVNQYELSGGIDPDDGEDLKFLTVTFSETLRQSGRLELPYEWLDESKTPEHRPAQKLVIAGIWDNADVAHEQVVYGTSTPDIPPDLIELRVFAGGQWHSQGKASKRSGDRWQRVCHFGNPESPAGSTYRLVALAPKTTLPDKIAELPIDAVKSEILSVTRSSPAKVSGEDKRLKECIEQREREQQLRAAVWHLKARARDIKRDWPGADFLDRPANKDLWITVRERPTPNDCDDRSWLGAAIRWHERFSASDAARRVDSKYLNSLDFDELIEFMDLYEHQECGDGYALPLPISTAPTGPKAAIIRFEKRGNLQRYGAIVKNYSTSAAFEVRIQPLRIGRYRFSFADTVNTLSAEDGEVFIEATAKAPDGITIGFSVFDAVRERFKCTDDGFVPVNARVTFKDADGRHYACRQEFEQHVTNKDSASTSVYVRRFEACD